MRFLVPGYAFQLTTSRRGRLVCLISSFFPFLFQLTTSRRGRLYFLAQKCNIEIYFNSLPHAEVDIVKTSFITSYEAFQLTTSRRGRRSNGNSRVQESLYFNSLPHAEVDHRLFLPFLHTHHFNSLPHAEVDSFRLSTRYPRRHFNSLPHAEVDTKKQQVSSSSTISTHYLTQR